MKSLALMLVLFTSIAFAQHDQKLPEGKWAYYGEQFYLTLNGKKNFDRTLFNKLFNESHSSKPGEFDVIDTQCVRGATCYRHQAVGYDRARIIMFGELDGVKEADGYSVIDVYCGKKFTYRAPEDVSRMGDQVNIEHTWPQSKFNGNYSKEMQKSDMHHLYPADSHANSVRGNSPFGILGVADDVLGGEGCANSRFGVMDVDVYTPPKNHRGNVARALFYFSMHYNLGIAKAEELVLRQWHKSDPVDAAEILRHERIAKYQKVRNPFIDHPETVEKVADF